MNQNHNIRHMLTFDVEEYFHCEAFRQVVGPERWHLWPSRIDAQMDSLLVMLERFSVRATFFVLGRVAEHRPDIVRQIAAAGHEVACHGDNHEMIQRLGPKGFADDSRAGKERLEAILGEPVLGYRAATFGLMRKTAWAIDTLGELGFQYDSSVQPVRHDRYGVPDAPPQAHLAAGPGGGRILEIPPMTRPLAGRNFPLGGGGYFRLLPVMLFDRGLRAWSSDGRPAMLYLHPWEFDAGQPVIPTGRLSRFRHRVNLGRTGKKLSHLLARHPFAPVREVLPQLLAQAKQSTAFSYV